MTEPNRLTKAAEAIWEGVREGGPTGQEFRGSIRRSDADYLASLALAGAGDAGDDYHSIDELYAYRMAYHAIVANQNPHLCVKSWRHSDGEECFGGGWFVVYMTLPTGQVSNHYQAEYWELFDVEERDVAPEWDGHTPEDALDRLMRFAVGGSK